MPSENWRLPIKAKYGVGKCWLFLYSLHLVLFYFQIAAVYNYRSSLENHLNLSVGDAVHIIEEYEGRKVIQYCMVHFVCSLYICNGVYFVLTWLQVVCFV